MRIVGYALLGLLAGAAAGFALGFLFVILWYDVLGIGSHGADGLSGFATFLVVTPLLSLIGGIVGAVWLGARARSGGGVAPTGIVGAVILALLVFFLLFAVVGVV